MQIQSVNTFNNSYNTNFKSTIPVVTMLGKTCKTGAIVTTEELNTKFLRKIQYLIDNSLKRGIDVDRDSYIDRLRAFIKSKITDFGGKVMMYTCVDGGLENSCMRPFAYMLTGQDKYNMETLREKFKNVVRFSQGYKTAELEIANDTYYNQGNFLIDSGYKRTSFPNMENPVFVACFEPMKNKNGEIARTRTGEIRDYTIAEVGFVPLESIQNPKLEIGKK